MQPDMEKNETEIVTDSEVKGQTVEETTVAPLAVDPGEQESERKEEMADEKKVDQVDEQPTKTLEKTDDQTDEEKAESSAKQEVQEELEKEAVNATENAEEKEEVMNEDIADDNSSASSSPSALHIHLEEDKEEHGVEPTLPQVSSVVSLSEPEAAAAAQVTPDNSQEPPGKEESSPSHDNNPRRATLKLKRGIEISFEVDRDGQPVTSAEQNQQQHVEGETGSSRKKAKLAEQLELQEDPELSGMDVSATVDAIARVQKDIRTLRFMAKQKEKEWNYILKLMKFKEEQQAKLMRRKEVLRIINSTEKVATKKAAAVATPTVAAASFTLPTPSSHVAGAAGAVPAPPSVYSSASSLHSLINQSLTAIMSNKGMKVTPQPTLPVATSNSVGIPSASPSAAGSAAAASANLSRHPRQRPILPKTSMQAHAYHETQMWNNTALVEQSSPSSHDLADMRRQGTVSVQSLIADYRAKHPEEVPIRGRRMRTKADHESPTPPASDNSGMSFKDVLVQFAKLSRGQGQGGEVAPVVAVSNNGNSSSSAAALQSLAAARTARSSTSPALGGSILQSALSGSRNVNSGFAPTLAQLLTSTAEQQQQQQQQAPVILGQTSIAPSSAEVLTLSNLLATSKGHVTITSDRESRNDDVILIGNSSQNRSGPSALPSGPKAANGDIPKCQGCNERVAQFVCAGCSSQWYCSRECQVAAWEDHSENCVG